VLKTERKNLGSNHSKLAFGYIDIGQVHALMKNYSLALSCYKKALKIQKKSLASNDPDLSDTRNKIRQMHDLIKNGGNDTIA
jgi:tetratricopeptide (TPR) repeat protein